jgi:hypothetical protein
MSDSADTAAPPAPTYRRFDTIGEYWTAVDEVLGRARREVLLFDTSIGPAFDRPHRIALLNVFLAAARTSRLRIMLHDAQSVPRDCPRLCSLLRQFGEKVSINQTLHDARSATDPLLVVDALHAVRRIHYTQPRSVMITDDPVAVRPLHDRLRQIHEASEPAVAPTVLGL